MKMLNKKLYFEGLHVLIFYCMSNKGASSCRLNIMMFRYKITYIFNSLVVSSDITVMNNVLQEIIKILLEKMLKAIKFVLIPQRCVRENLTDSINSLSNEPRIDE